VSEVTEALEMTANSIAEGKNYSRRSANPTETYDLNRNVCWIR